MMVTLHRCKRQELVCGFTSFFIAHGALKEDVIVATARQR